MNDTSPEYVQSSDIQLNNISIPNFTLPTSNSIKMDNTKPSGLENFLNLHQSETSNSLMTENVNNEFDQQNKLNNNIEFINETDSSMKNYGNDVEQMQLTNNSDNQETDQKELNDEDTKKRQHPSDNNNETTEKKKNPVKRQKKGPKEWTTQDHLLLKDAIMSNSDLAKIAKSIRFSCRFTPQELEERWKLMLYDPEISIQIAKDIATIPPTTKRVLWTQKEENILIQEASKSDFNGFQALLEKYRSKFHPSRTARSLEAHYYKMKRGGMIQETSTPSNNEIANEKSETETKQNPNIITSNLFNPVDWSTNPNAKAVIRGKNVLYFLNSEKCVIGRATKDHVVDVNIGEEGDASKISRTQSVITMISPNEYILENTGKATTTINGNFIETGKAVPLPQRCILGFNDFRFLFQVNTNSTINYTEVSNNVKNNDKLSIGNILSL